MSTLVLCAGNAFAAAQCLSGKVVHLYRNSKLVFAFNETSRQGAEVAAGNAPVFRDHQHRIQPGDSIAIGCCVDTSTTDAYGITKAAKLFETVMNRQSFQSTTISNRYRTNDCLHHIL